MKLVTAAQRLRGTPKKGKGSDPDAKKRQNLGRAALPQKTKKRQKGPFTIPKRQILGIFKANMDLKYL